jgi:hypothetical protein
MPRRRPVLRTLAATIALVLGAAAPAAARDQAPPGFQLDLRGGVHVECWVQGGTLRCLDYARATAPGRCDAGGDVPTTVLRRTGGLRRTSTCVDEGYHGWSRLRSTRTFRSGAFTCRVRDARRVLRCANRTTTVTMARA